MGGVDPASEVRGGRFQQYLAAKSHNGFATVREMKHSLLHNTAWQNNGRQNGLISRMLLSEWYKIMAHIVTFCSLRGRSSQSPPCIRPVSCWLLFTSSSRITV